MSENTSDHVKLRVNPVTVQFFMKAVTSFWHFIQCISGPCNSEGHSKPVGFQMCNNASHLFQKPTWLEQRWLALAIFLQKHRMSSPKLYLPPYNLQFRDVLNNFSSIALTLYFKFVHCHKCTYVAIIHSIDINLLAFAMAISYPHEYPQYFSKPPAPKIFTPTLYLGLN